MENIKNLEIMNKVLKFSHENIEEIKKQITSKSSKFIIQLSNKEDGNNTVTIEYMPMYVVVSTYCLTPLDYGLDVSKEYNKIYLELNDYFIEKKNEVEKAKYDKINFILDNFKIMEV